MYADAHNWHMSDSWKSIPISNYLVILCNIKSDEKKVFVISKQAKQQKKKWGGHYNVLCTLLRHFSMA